MVDELQELSRSLLLQFSHCCHFNHMAAYASCLLLVLVITMELVVSQFFSR
jgi:hypothetical protein